MQLQYIEQQCQSFQFIMTAAERDTIQKSGDLIEDRQSEHVEVGWINGSTNHRFQPQVIPLWSLL